MKKIIFLIIALPTTMFLNGSSTQSKPLDKKELTANVDRITENLKLHQSRLEILETQIPKITTVLDQIIQTSSQKTSQIQTNMNQLAQNQNDIESKTKATFFEFLTQLNTLKTQHDNLATQVTDLNIQNKMNTQAQIQDRAIHASRIRFLYWTTGVAIGAATIYTVLRTNILRNPFKSRPNLPIIRPTLTPLTPPPTPIIQTITPATIPPIIIPVPIINK